MEEIKAPQHSPLPWHVGSFPAYIYDVNGNGTAAADSQWEVALRYANAEFIVRAVNSHDELLEALEEARACIVALMFDIQRGELPHERVPEVLEMFDHFGPQMDAAIRKARGEE